MVIAVNPTWMETDNCVKVLKWFQQYHTVKGVNPTLTEIVSIVTVVEDYNSITLLLVF